MSTKPNPANALGLCRGLKTARPRRFLASFALFALLFAFGDVAGPSDKSVFAAYQLDLTSVTS